MTTSVPSKMGHYMQVVIKSEMNFKHSRKNKGTLLLYIGLFLWKGSIEVVDWMPDFLCYNLNYILSLSTYVC